MRWALATLLAVSAAIAAATSVQPARASCAAVVKWRGTVYSGISPRVLPLPRGPRIGTGIVPGCDDVITEPPLPPEPDADVAIHGIRDVDPRLGVVLSGRREALMLFLAPGFFPADPAFPLHAAIYGRGVRTNATAGCTKRPRRILAGRVEGSQLFTFGSIRLVGRRDRIETDGHTRYALPTVAGQPHVRGGDRVRIELVPCKVAGRSATKLVARRISLVR